MHRAQILVAGLLPTPSLNLKPNPFLQTMNSQSPVCHRTNGTKQDRVCAPHQKNTSLNKTPFTTTHTFGCVLIYIILNLFISYSQDCLQIGGLFLTPRAIRQFYVRKIVSLALQKTCVVFSFVLIKDFLLPTASLPQSAPCF